MKTYLWSLIVLLSFVGLVHANELIDAIKDKDIQKIEKLLKQGDIDITARAENNIDVISLALIWFGPEPRKAKQVIDLLLQAGADINAARKASGFSFFITPLHMAILITNVDLVKFLIERGADVNIQPSNSSMTPLHEIIFVICMSMGDTSFYREREFDDKAYHIVETLLRNGADKDTVIVDEKTNKKFTALDMLRECTKGKNVSQKLSELTTLLEG